MKKRIIASLLTASMLAAALAGCGEARRRRRIRPQTLQGKRRVRRVIRQR